ncbi:MAG: hypothetical protein Q8R79_04880 [Legionellaceae bacterium]|nr:hypothetical protein [Legionellaceae bacterium]
MLRFYKQEKDDKLVIPVSSLDTNAEVAVDAPSGVRLCSLGDSSCLYWDGLSALLRKGAYYFAWKNYYIQQPVTLDNLKGTGFMFFQMMPCSGEHGSSLQHDVDDGAKLHVALRPDNLQAAFNPLLTVLSEEGVRSFKFILAHKLEGLYEQGQFGKIVTIYTYGMTPSQISALAKKIDRVLSALEIHPAEKRATDCETRQDSLLEDCRFITIAYPRDDLVKSPHLRASMLDVRDRSSRGSTSVSTEDVETMWRQPSSVNADSLVEARGFCSPLSLM